MQARESRLRSAVATLMRATPSFRGKGRLVLALDAALARLAGSEAVGPINGVGRMHFDLVAWGQKFAYYYGGWERDHIACMRRLYPGGDFIDVGSSLGLYVVCMGDLVRSAGAMIHSIEPLGFNIDRQRRNIALNALDDVVCIHDVALGQTDAWLRIAGDPEQHDNNAFVVEAGGTRVRMMTLDALVQRHVRGKVGFIKMDVEGFEPRVIEGASRVLEEHRPIVFAEFNRERMAINGFDIGPSWDCLDSLGYRAFRLAGGRLVRLAFPGDEENIFFLPPGTVPPAG